MASRDDQRMYRFDLLDRTGVFLGFGLVQLGLLGAGGLASTLAVTAGAAPPGRRRARARSPSVWPLGRVGGERLVDWLPVAVRWVARSPASPMVRAAPPARPRQPRRRAADAAAVPRRHPPARGARATGAGSPVPASCTTRPAARCRRSCGFAGQDFALAPRDEQVRLLAGWGDVLAGFATERGAVARLSWSDFTTPTGMRDHLAWLATQPTHGSDAAESYRELLNGTGALSAGHDVLVTVTVTRERLTGGRGARDADERLLAVLGKAVDTLVRGPAHRRPRSPTTRSPPARSPPSCAAGSTRRGCARRRPARSPSASASSNPPTPARWPSRSSGAGCGPTAPGTAPTGSPSGRASPSTPTGWSRSSPSPAAARAPSRCCSSRSRRRRRGAGSTATRSSSSPTPPAVPSEAGGSTPATAASKRRSPTGRTSSSPATPRSPTPGSSPSPPTTIDELRAACDECEQLAREHGLELRPLDGRQDLAWAAALPLGLGLARTWVA